MMFIVLISGEKNIKKFGREMTVNNPSQFPDPFIVEQYLEPMVIGTIITPGMYLWQPISIQFSSSMTGENLC